MSIDPVKDTTGPGSKEIKGSKETEEQRGILHSLIAR